jgi:hypothetical protein
MIAAAVLLLLAMSNTAYAYIDPNTGGLFFQILGPLFAGVAAVWVVAKEKLATAFRRLWHRFIDK